MDIEGLAVSRVTVVIGRCPRLHPTVTSNDKTPFTDGHIDLYHKPKKTKVNWAGRVDVQVKGRSLAPKRRPPETFPISRTDLLAYQQNSGVLYFVVWVNSKTGKAAATMYALLSPFAIAQLFRDTSDDQATISVPVRKFPNDPNEIHRLIEVALKTRQQNVSTGFDPALFERVESITVFPAVDLDLTEPVTLKPVQNDFALVLNTVDGMSVPFDGMLELVPPEYLPRRVAMSVGSGDVRYDSVVTQRLDATSYSVELSEGLRFVVHGTGPDGTTNVNVTLESTLRGRLKSLQFFAALLDTRAIEFDGRRMPFEVKRGDDTTDMRAHLRTLEQLVELLERLGVDIDLIDPNDIDDAQAKQLHFLYRAFVQGEEIVDTSSEIARATQRVGAWDLMFLVTPGADDRHWRLVDPFAPETGHQFRWSADEESGGRTIPITAYDTVEPEYLTTVLNMRLDRIVNAYEEIADFETTRPLANQRVLELTRAADSSPVRSLDLLRGAEALNEWLIAQEGETPTNLLNRWQILARQGPLAADVVRDIRRLKRQITVNNGGTVDTLEVACAILIGDADEVADLLAQLPENDVTTMKDWPIWKLAEPSDGLTDVA
ncbi:MULTISPECIES: hypothetical protein [unclassified Microbacterium]|uniref:hypothetical protein n=1 Tax=unclassified Microbacterium TaxID=2609290 RepID=UPI00300F94CC